MFRKHLVLASVLVLLSLVAVPGSADTSLTVTNAAAMEGNFGMEVTHTTTGPYDKAYVTSLEPTDETVLRVRFLFNYTNCTFANKGGHTIIMAREDTFGTVWRLNFVYNQTMDKYVARLFTYEDDGTLRFVGGAVITAVDTPIGVEWSAASAPGANDGRVALYKFDVTTAGRTKTNIDNDTQNVDKVLMGTVTNPNATTSGSLYFDSYESYRTLSQ
jgi:hypothetical protein